jgi:signal transduction histidine kinase
MKQMLRQVAAYRFPLLLACVAGLFAASVVLALASDAAHERQVADSARTQARILANSVTAALAFDDEEVIGQYVRAFSANPDILAVAVYDETGRRVAQYGQGLNPADFRPGRQSDASGASIGVTEAVMQKGQKLGAVFFRQKTETLWTRIGRYAGAAFILVVAALLLSVTVFDARALTRSNQRLIEEMQQRESAEAALRQSQKMEAVGRLTGGIAHDFNNMLAVITGNNELLLRKFPDADPMIMRFISTSQDAARRATALTQRLLAFSRRQALDPKPSDPAKIILDMTDLLRRTLGETIAVHVANAAGLWPVFIDVSQLEIALVNLAVNARDAMPGGGVLRIETANIKLEPHDLPTPEEVRPGPYVVISVSDTGEGMPPEILEQVFEPFFTTKGVGQGTGLGLSQVHGFVRQSGGHIAIESQVGCGTCVRLYLPRAECDAHIDAGQAQPVAPMPTRRRRSILVVDDEAGVREFAVTALKELGYDAYGAGSGDEAIQTVAEGAAPHVLLTDVVMPGKSGRETADLIRQRLPQVEVIYMTGYTEADIIHGGKIDRDVHLLNKPFNLTDLQNAMDALES